MIISDLIVQRGLDLLYNKEKKGSLTPSERQLLAILRDKNLAYINRIFEDKPDARELLLSLVN